MGNQTNKADNYPIEYLGHINQNYFGNIRLYQTIDKQYQVIQVPSHTYQAQNVLKFSNLQHQNLVPLITYEQNASDLDQGQLLYYFQYYDTPLDQILKMREKRGQFFTENEVLRITADLLNCLEYLDSQEESHNDVRTSSIFYDKQSKQVKMYNNSLVFGRYQLYNDLVRNQNPKKQYCTPEIANIIEKTYKNMDIDRDYSLNPAYKQYIDKYQHKIDIFLLGLTLLEICTYKESHTLYNPVTHQMDFCEISERLGQVNNSYGSEIFNIIKNMLYEDPSKRYSAKQLLAIRVQTHQTTTNNSSIINNSSLKSSRIIYSQPSPEKNVSIYNCSPQKQVVKIQHNSPQQKIVHISPLKIAQPEQIQKRKHIFHSSTSTYKSPIKKSPLKITTTSSFKQPKSNIVSRKVITNPSPIKSVMITPTRSISYQSNRRFATPLQKRILVSPQVKQIRSQSVLISPSPARKIVFKNNMAPISSNTKSVKFLVPPALPRPQSKVIKMQQPKHMSQTHRQNQRQQYQQSDEAITNNRNAFSFNVRSKSNSKSTQYTTGEISNLQSPFQRPNASENIFQQEQQSQQQQQQNQPIPMNKSNKKPIENIERSQSVSKRINNFINTNKGSNRVIVSIKKNVIIPQKFSVQQSSQKMKTFNQDFQTTNSSKNFKERIEQLDERISKTIKQSKKWTDCNNTNKTLKRQQDYVLQK